MKVRTNFIDTRKWEYNRREVSESYKKNKEFIVNSKKRVQTILENLLKDDFEQNPTENSTYLNKSSEITSQEQASELREKQEELDHSTSNIEKKIETLEEVRKSALSSPSPSIQDLRIAISATNQLALLQGKHKQSKDLPNTNLELLERLKNQNFLPKEKDILHNKNEIDDKTFQTIIAKYKSQMQMAENNFKIEMPKYAFIA